MDPVLYFICSVILLVLATVPKKGSGHVVLRGAGFLAALAGLVYSFYLLATGK